MENQELAEIAEHVHRPSDRAIGVTMAIVAALLAVVTLMGHRLHTEEVVLQTKAADGWAYYQAKNSRYHMYATDAKLASLIGPNGAGAAADWVKKGDEEKQQAEEIPAAERAPRRGNTEGRPPCQLLRRRGDMSRGRDRAVLDCSPDRCAGVLVHVVRGHGDRRGDCRGRTPPLTRPPTRAASRAGSSPRALQARR